MLTKSDKNNAAAVVLGGLSLLSGCAAPDRVSISEQAVPLRSSGASPTEAAPSTPDLVSQSLPGLPPFQSESTTRIYALNGNQSQGVPDRTAGEWLSEVAMEISKEDPNARISVYTIKYGNSTRIGTTSESVAAELAEHLKALPLAPDERIVLFGHCQGGLILSTLLHRHEHDQSFHPDLPWDRVSALVTVDPPLAGGWLSGQKTIDYIVAPFDFITFGVFADLSYPVSRDMRPGSEVLNLCETPAVHEIRFERRYQDGERVFHQISGQQAGDQWDHDPFSNAHVRSNPRNIELLDTVKRTIRATISAGNSGSGHTSSDTSK